jgi:hypothetical protein
MRLNTTNITGWRLAKKTKGVKAKPMTALISDPSVASKFLIDTLEGREPIGKGTVFCIGEAGDAWQQDSNKLLKKYNILTIDPDGWMICEPKPENETNAVQVTDEVLALVCPDYPKGDNIFEASIPFTIIGHWGAVVGAEKNVQTGRTGDYLCQNPADPTDVWIVAKKIFENTYSFK